MTEALRRYAQHRDRYHPAITTTAFFVTERGTSLKDWRVRMAFNGLRQRFSSDRLGRRVPRIHDLRHTFAVRRLLAWYRNGIAVDEKMAALATYLGHVKVTDTYWYITAVPDLLAAASRHAERAIARRGGS